MDSVTRGLSHHYNFYVNENAGIYIISNFLYKKSLKC